VAHRNRCHHAVVSAQRQQILVVDDEPSIVDAVATALRYEGYDVQEATSGRQALDVATRAEPDLIVLDWMLPDIEGIEVGRRLRARGSKSAILFLTAKDATENKVEALRAGGDDYVTKPFSLAELVARVQAILRRTRGDLPGDVLRVGEVVLDEARHEVFRGDRQVLLTATEFSLLRYFMLNPRCVLSKHTPPGTPVSVRVAAEDGSAVIEVTDSGPGLTLEEQSHVFERFYRADPSRARASGGSGLGLSIAAAVTEAHGGTLAVESGAGVGATFRIALPLAHGDS
jgi:two-component system, OmpR family, response regulator